MPFALNLTPDPDASLDVERVLAGLSPLGVGEEQLVTQYGPCVTLLVIEDSVHPDDLLEMLRRHVLRTASIPLTLLEPCIIPGNPPTLSLRAAPVQALLTLHNAMFRSVPEQAVHLHYRPAYWQPHLKLANVSADPVVSRAIVERVAATWAPLQGWLVAFEAVHYPPVEAIWHGRLLQAADGA